MQKIISLILCAVLAFFSSFPGLISGELKAKDFLEEIKTEYIEKISDSVGISKRVFSVFFDDDVNAFAAKKIIKKIGGKTVGFNSLLNEYKVYFDQSIDNCQEFCEQLQKLDGIVCAIPQIAVKIAPNSEGDEEKYIPNDPWNGNNQWDEEHPGGLNWHLEAIQALSAWQYKDRMSTIDLGVVDGGVYVDHEDLQGKIVFPSKYLERTNSVDTHGTHVCGIISANADNGIGVCGVCPNAKIHFVDWDPEYNSLSQTWLDIERIYSGVCYTIKDGAKVVNLSLGADLWGNMKKFPTFVVNIVGNFVSAIMARLIKQGYDFVICQAAGNGDNSSHAINAENNLSFCAVSENNCISQLFGVKKSDVLDRIIVVGSAALAADGSFYQPAYSNVGARVDICAPGNYVFSTVDPGKGFYAYMSGTSMATPVVTAVCGLVWSIDSSFTGSMVKKIVCSPETAGPLVKATTQQVNPDVNYMDYHMVNAKLSVEKAIEISERLNNNG
ncbi:MAG: S8 family serine peptidase [Clostridia bacterium]|nr:S8 family serine peptidase [Clostridia bacterium]